MLSMAYPFLSAAALIAFASNVASHAAQVFAVITSTEHVHVRTYAVEHAVNELGFQDL